MIDDREIDVMPRGELEVEFARLQKEHAKELSRGEEKLNEALETYQNVLRKWGIL